MLLPFTGEEPPGAMAGIETTRILGSSKHRFGVPSYGKQSKLSVEEEPVVSMFDLQV